MELEGRQQICCSCEAVITDRYICKVLDGFWHEKCMVCNSCGAFLRGTCYGRGGKLYCKDDFYRLFGAKCSGCKKTIGPSEMVHKLASRTFHVECLKCSQCTKIMCTGEQIFLNNAGMFVCKDDFVGLANSTYAQATGSCNNKHKEAGIKSPSNPRSTESLPSDEDDDVNKRRGPRTTIKAKQLDVLKASFLATPKPSKHIREKLAKDTGLTMRVIQVWFQNRRSKERRVMHLSVHEPRRTFRKNSTSKDSPSDMNYPFFPNNNSNHVMKEYPGQNFPFEPFANTTVLNIDTSNSIPLSLPMETDNILPRDAMSDCTVDGNVFTISGFHPNAFNNFPSLPACSPHSCPSTNDFEYTIEYL